jgi:hypothetical protein
MLEKNWASPKDFATLFQYFWHRDFPIGEGAPGARRTDWTIHIGIIVRQIADLMGLVARFERGGRKDAVLRSSDGDEIALEWEWKTDWAKELNKLKSADNIFKNEKNQQKLLKFAVLIIYSDKGKNEVCTDVEKKWAGAGWPLLLILLTYKKVPRKKFPSRRDFNKIQMYLIDKDKKTELRSVSACPWRVSCTRWFKEDKSQ